MISKERIQHLLDKAIEAHVFPGYAAAVVTPQESLFFTGGKHTYDDSSLKVTEDTLYDVASLTKILGPMSVMMLLVGSDKVHLDDPIGVYLPEFVTDTYKKEATIRHLLTYTLDYDLPGGAKSLMKEISPDELVARMIQLPLKCAPGTSYMYSNITAFILTKVIEKITGEILYDTVSRDIFSPLEMSTATFFPDKNMWQQIPPTEITEDRGVVQGFVHDESTYHLQSGNKSSGAAGLFASVKDVAKFLSMVVAGGSIHGERFFSPTIVNAWTENQFPDLLPTLTPLGWGDFNNEFIDPEHGKCVVKGGFTGCFMAYNLENAVGFVILSNTTYPVRPKDRAQFNVIKKEILNLLTNEK